MSVSEPVIVTESPVKVVVSEMHVVALTVFAVVVAVAARTGRDRV